MLPLVMEFFKCNLTMVDSVELQHSIIFTSGSTIFGNSLDDTHRFTGMIFSISDNLLVGSETTNKFYWYNSFQGFGSFGIIENNTQIAGFRPIINQTADFSFFIQCWSLSHSSW